MAINSGTLFLSAFILFRAVGKSENPEGGGARSHVVGINPQPLNRIGLNDLPKSRTGVKPYPSGPTALCHM